MKRKKRWRWIAAGAACILLYILFLEWKISEASTMEPEKNADYIIILGARVKGTVPSLSLKYRIEAASSYLKENHETAVIVSGGQGPGEDISEAEAMKRELLDRGISDERILLEDRSTSTKENIRFSKELLPPGADSVHVVTNDYHIYRAVQIARSEGLETGGIPAVTPQSVKYKSRIREYLAITKYFLLSPFD